MKTIDEKILGGAKRTAPRKRGFHDWNPQKRNRLLLDQVQAVLTEYEAHLPLTVRQVFYRLVGAYGYAKTENAYKNLGEILGFARRAQIIRMDAIPTTGLSARTP